jgi:hypothetical protein
MARVNVAGKVSYELPNNGWRPAAARCRVD